MDNLIRWIEFSSNTQVLEVEAKAILGQLILNGYLQLELVKLEVLKGKFKGLGFNKEVEGIIILGANQEI